MLERLWRNVLNCRLYNCIVAGRHADHAHVGCLTKDKTFLLRGFSPENNEIPIKNFFCIGCGAQSGQTNNIRFVLEVVSYFGAYNLLTACPCLTSDVYYTSVTDGSNFRRSVEQNHSSLEDVHPRHTATISYSLV